MLLQHSSYKLLQKSYFQVRLFHNICFLECREKLLDDETIYTIVLSSKNIIDW